MERTIQPKMVDFFMKKLKGNGLFLHAVDEKLPRVIFRLANESLVGIREVGGNNRGPMVELIQKTLGDADRESWCMSQQQTCIALAEELTGIASLIYPSEHCLTVWNNTPKTCRVKTIPLPGAITIWRHGKTTDGHTGCTGGYRVDAKKGDTFESYEGNTESGIIGGNVERDGGGSYYVIRPVSGSGDMKVVGWLKPFEQ